LLKFRKNESARSNQSPQPPTLSKAGLWRPLVKALVAFVIVLMIFSLGFAAGRGDLKIRDQLANNASQSLPEDLNYSAVEEVYDQLKAAYDGQIDSAKLLDGLKRGLVASTGDPYTEFFDPQEAKEFDEALSGSFTGIGAELGKNSDGQIIVVSPLSGYPAEKAGLRAQDKIAAIDGKSTTNLSITAAVRQIRGAEGTKVTLTIVRGNDQPFEITITRARINLPSVEYKIEGGIGYLKINQFNEDTAPEARRAAQEFKDKEVKGVILDLRGNPGGYLSGAVDIASLWLPEGTTVVTERRGGQTVSIEKASGSSTLRNIPTVVLIDKGSASASEITAGALRDHKAAKLVGTKTFGKGSVQRIDELSDGSELKVTIAHWFTPAGKNIDKEGITPDFIAESSQNGDTTKDPQKDKATQLLN